MNELISAIFTSFTQVIGGIAGGIQQAFTKLLYADGTSGEFSPLVLFLFTMAGIALASGIVYKIFALVKGKTHP